MAKVLEQDLFGLTVQAKYHNQIEVISTPDKAVSNLVISKGKGFDHLVNILCVDWIKDGKFQVTYNLWSYNLKLHITFKVMVDRKKPVMPTIMELWPHAQVYERELHEMFGVDFPGNPDLRPLFLHNWHDIPPMRKDFDTEAYSMKAYSYKDAKRAIKEGGKA